MRGRGLAWKAPENCNFRLINLIWLLIADAVHPIIVQHDRGKCHNFRKAAARSQSQPVGGVAPGEGNNNKPPSESLSMPSTSRRLGFHALILLFSLVNHSMTVFTGMPELLMMMRRMMVVKENNT